MHLLWNVDRDRFFQNRSNHSTTVTERSSMGIAKQKSTKLE